MTTITLADLQASVKDKSAFGELGHYFTLCHTFLMHIEEAQPTRIISPTHHNYVFYQGVRGIDWSEFSLCLFDQ